MNAFASSIKKNCVLQYLIMEYKSPTLWVNSYNHPTHETCDDVCASISGNTFACDEVAMQPFARSYTNFPIVPNFAQLGKDAGKFAEALMFPLGQIEVGDNSTITNVGLKVNVIDYESELLGDLRYPEQNFNPPPINLGIQTDKTLVGRILQRQCEVVNIAQRNPTCKSKGLLTETQYNANTGVIVEGGRQMMCPCSSEGEGNLHVSTNEVIPDSVPGSTDPEKRQKQEEEEVDTVYRYNGRNIVSKDGESTGDRTTVIVEMDPDGNLFSYKASKCTCQQKDEATPDGLPAPCDTPEALTSSVWIWWVMLSFAILSVVIVVAVIFSRKQPTYYTTRAAASRGTESSISLFV